MENQRKAHENVHELTTGSEVKAGTVERQTSDSGKGSWKEKMEKAGRGGEEINESTTCEIWKS